jgi:hypothetical protein
MSVSLNNVNGTLNSVNSENDTHRAATNNPHNVTATQVGAYTKSEVDGLVNNSSDWIDIKRFKSGVVGNKYATSGYPIDGSDDNFDGTADTATIDGGIGGGTTKLDGALTSGQYWVLIYYPGSGSNWYTNTYAFNTLRWRQIAVQNSWIIPYNTTPTRSYTTENPPCDTTAGSGSLKAINYIYGNGQSYCTTLNGSTTWIRCRSDGEVDLHLRSGNTASWSYVVVTFLKYSNSN